MVLIFLFQLFTGTGLRAALDMELIKAPLSETSFSIGDFLLLPLNVVRTVN